MTQIHQAATTGYTSGTSAYLRGRPTYPEPVKNWLRETLLLGQDKTVLDVGAGTGKFIPLLQSTNAAIHALEPVEAMRAEIETNFPQVKTMAGSAENIPLPDASLDAIICAQAFHWFATPATLNEFSRILKPGGKLGLIWNVRDETKGWVASLTDIMTPYEEDVPRYHTGQWRKMFPTPGFSALQETQFPHQHTGAPEDVIIARVLSVSFIAALPKDERAKITQKIRTLIAGTPELCGQKTVSFPYTTAAFCCTKQT